MRQEYSAGKLSLKLLAAFLTFTMFLSSLPTEVIARELDTLRLAQSAASEDITEKSEPAIVGEIIDRRGDARKEFILDNGVRMAVVYPMAVHYRDGDSWQEIDNTLTLDSKDNTYHNNKQANEWARSVGEDSAESLKKGYVDNNVSKFGILKDKKTGQLFLKGVVSKILIKTDYYLKK